jgi:hypothetical protein
MERLEDIKDKIKEGGKSPGKEDRRAHEKIDKLESEMAKDRTKQQDHEWYMKEDMEIQDVKDSRKEMERKLEGAMEQIKILNMNSGRVCVDRKTLVREVTSRIKEKATGNNRE